MSEEFLDIVRLGYNQTGYLLVEEAPGPES